MRPAALPLLALVSCGGGRVEGDLDTETRAPAPVARCQDNCQSADWIDRRALDALADIAVCLDLPAYAPAGLEGAVTIAFRELPCRQAIAQVAAAAGLRMVISTVEGRRAVLLRRGGPTAEKLVLLPRGDGWRPAGPGQSGAAGGSGAGGGDRRRKCLDGCGDEVRSCMERCHWNDNACVRACQDRYRLCTDAC
jgi:hypothetical protein